MEGDVGSDWKEREWNKKMGGGGGTGARGRRKKARVGAIGRSETERES